MRCEEREDLLGCERQECLRQLLCSSRFSPELMQGCGPAEGDGLAERVRNILGNGNALRPLSRMACSGLAEAASRRASSEYAWQTEAQLNAWRKMRGRPHSGSYEGYALLQMCPRGDQFGGPEQFTAHLEMGIGEKLPGLAAVRPDSSSCSAKRPSSAQIPTDQDKRRPAHRAPGNAQVCRARPAGTTRARA